jgi:hypothetical protein
MGEARGCEQLAFSYVVWTDTLFQGKIFELSTDERYPNKLIGECPPTYLVAARTFLDVATGRICEIDDEELHRAAYAQVDDTEACEPIPLPARAKCEWYITTIR